MKILFLSQRFLLPMDTGGKIRTGKILEQLSGSHEITLISNVELQKDDPYLSEMSNLCTKFIPVPWKEIKKHSQLFYIKLFFQMFSRYPVSVLNDYSSGLKSTVEKVCKNNDFDIAICDFVQSALNFKEVKGIPTILFQHNVESVISWRHVDNSKNILARLFWWLQWKKMFRFEKKACESFDTVIAVSNKDKELFEKLYGVSNISTIPTGVDTDFFTPMKDTVIKKNSLVFCGSMDWLPNEDAILFFVKGVLPELRKKIKDVSLTVVGRNPSPALQKLIKDYPEVTLTGWVEDTRPYIANSAIFIVPIRVGGGTRMKIYEAMAMGKSVISTTIGAEGLPVSDGENILIEDDPVNFGTEIIKLLSQPEKNAIIGKKARDYVRSNFSWERVSLCFEEICLIANAKINAGK